MALTNVDFPDPFGPRITQKSPSSTSMEACSRARMLPEYEWLTFSAFRIVMALMINVGPFQAPRILSEA
jgi:hypothetical protein